MTPSIPAPRAVLRLLARAVALLGLAFIVTACGTTGGSTDATGPHPTGAGGRYKVGSPYEVKGVWYYPQEDPLYDETGIASWYGPGFAGRKTANGEIFDPKLVSAAHKTLPMPVNVRVTNLENGKSIVARVNDRGPYKPGRIIDMSEQGAILLGFKAQGMTRVRVQFVGIADLPDGKPGQRVKGRGEEAAIGRESGARTAPSGAVESGELAPPPGTVAAAPPPPIAAAPVPISSAAPVDEADGTVTQVAVSGRGLIYVQAGAFLARENADRLLRRLRSIAQFSISPKNIEGKMYYRVRAGPIDSVDEADGILDEVLRDGQSGAQIVVE
ncbi:Endolytic peptidoglycan transglycosylase RlpA [Alphaproteobacteria bacterium SO-S41]|nr:Endolytic peptidoglycan transglycosylase RlpA [Alphaproteobacteria bacterium SO-S41]